VYGSSTGAALAEAAGAAADATGVAFGFAGADATLAGGGGRVTGAGRSVDGPGGGSLRHPLDHTTAPPTVTATRKPMTLAITLDRSGGGAPGLPEGARAARASPAVRGRS